MKDKKIKRETKQTNARINYTKVHKNESTMNKLNTLLMDKNIIGYLQIVLECLDL